MRARQRHRTARAVDLRLFHRLDEGGLGAHVAPHRIQSGREQGTRVVAGDCIHIRLQLERFGIGEPEGLVLGRLQAIAVVQRSFHSFGCPTHCLQHAIREKARAHERHRLHEAGLVVVLDVFDRATTCKKRVHRIRPDRADFGEQGLKLHVRKRYPQFLDHRLTLRLEEGVLESFDRLFAGRIAPGQSHHIFYVRAFGHDFAHRKARLPVGEGRAEDVRGA